MTAALDLIRHFESFRLTAYQDSGGVWTIGWGHTGPDVAQGHVWTQAHAYEALQGDVAVAEAAVRALIAVPLMDCQHDALTSFTFNLGRAALKRSILRKLLNQGEYALAADQFLLWNKDNGQVLPGLTRRRRAERALFLGLDWRQYA